MSAEFTVKELWPEEHFVIDPSGIAMAVGRNEAQAQGIARVLNEIAVLRGELASIDEAFARRPALADCETRAGKIYRACNQAGEADRLRNELKDTKILLAEKNQTANTFMEQIRRLQEDLAATQKERDDALAAFALAALAEEKGT